RGSPLFPYTTLFRSGVAFVSVRLGVTYGVSPIMKTTPTFMTVPNLFCQRAARGEPLQVFEDRPVAFIHVQDAAQALIRGADRLVDRKSTRLNSSHRT